MKDLTHYFTDTTKSCESPPSDGKDNTEGDQQEYRGSSPKKRKRVKIKISRTNSKTRVCDIVESKNDMIDKTPSPFTKAKCCQKINKDLFDETPKKIESLLPAMEHDFTGKQNNLIETAKEDKSVHVLKERNEKSDRRKLRRNRNNSSRDSNSGSYLSSDSKDVSLSNKNNTVDDECSEREQSNAFQVLMNSSKPIQTTSPQNSLQEKIATSKNSEDKDKLKKNKEKLLILADKKGYSKRKLAELHEGEQIERKIENRMKLFKTDTKLDEDCQKHLSGNLLNYFSKTPLMCPQKDANSSSTFVVKADVHMPDNAFRNCFQNNALQITDANDTKKQKKLSRVDRVKFSRSEKVVVVDDLEDNQVTAACPRPRWSMKIKLHPSKDEEFSGVTSDEEIVSPKSQERFKEISSCINNDIPYNDKELDLKMIKSKEGRERSKNRKSGKTKLSTEEISNSDSLGSGMLKCMQEVKDVSKCNGMIVGNSDEVMGLSAGLGRNGSNDALNQKGKEKLAPLFTRKIKPDQAAVSARRLFLQSDCIENNSKKIEKKDRNTTLCFSPFPIISHVNQYTDSSDSKMNDIKISMRSKTTYTPTMNVHHFKDVLDLEDMSIISAKNVKKLVHANVEEALTDIEAHCTDARKMWEYVSSVAQTVGDTNAKNVSPEGKTKDRRSGSKKGTTVEAKNKESKVCHTWTYKYKPLSSQYVVGNQDAAAKLKLWLDGWRSSIKEDDNSDNEFYSSDCSLSGSNDNNHVAVLIGPHGVGKSASVYAVAEELGYRVLEVNASSKRAGKKILKELEEATKSHRVKKNQIKTAFFAVNEPQIENKTPQKTLILLEDIDLIFDEDEGFVNATYQLVSNTKRPIVMTCRDVYPYLNKMAPQQNKIYFQSVESSSIWALAELICLAETGHRVPHNYLTELSQSGDLRKAILQLQFLLLSGPLHFPKQCINGSKNLWQDMRHCIYKPTIKDTKKPLPKKYQKKGRTQNKIENAMDNLICKLDVMSVATSLMDVDDPALDLSNVRVRPSLSLTEDTSPYCVTNNISSDIGWWLRDKVMSSGPIKGNGKPKQNNILLRKQLNTGVDFALSSVAPLNLDRRAMSVDYLSSVRTICRAEELRLTMNSKRGNRFFHYLQGLRLPATSIKPNILSAACKMMQEKVQNDTSTIINID